MCELFSEKTNKKLIAFLNGCPKSFHRLDECRFADFVYQSILDYCRVDDFNKDKFKEYINNVYNFTDKEIDVWLDIYKRIEYLIDNIMYTLPNYGEIIVKIYNIEERY